MKSFWKSLLFRIKHRRLFAIRKRSSKILERFHKPGEYTFFTGP